jgi:hypothetical protein
VKYVTHAAFGSASTVTFKPIRSSLLNLTGRECGRALQTDYRTRSPSARQPPGSRLPDGQILSPGSDHGRGTTGGRAAKVYTFIAATSGRSSMHSAAGIRATDYKVALISSCSVMGAYKADVLIVGAGPCGLGAATRLEKFRAEAGKALSYLLVEARTGPGGCASSTRHSPPGRAGGIALVCVH